jgi:hypothetical protein
LIRWDANSKDNIDNWKYDTDMGGGKTCSTIWNNRGDSHTYSALSRYSETCTFTATVLDDNELPVDGVDVWVLSNYFYDPDSIAITTWGTTDFTGKCTFELGNSRNYWSSAESDNLGEDPPDQSGNEYVTHIVDDTQPDTTYTHTFHLPQAAPKLQATTATLPTQPWGKYKMEVSYSVLNNIVQGYNIFTGEHSDMWGVGGNIDFFVANDYNFSEYDAGRPFEAYGVTERSSDNDVSLTLPLEDNWYGVLSNEFAQRSTKTVNITFNLYGMINGEIITPEDDETLDLDSTVSITGTAFSPIGLTSVELDFDNADDWEPATFTSRDLSESWEFDWDTKGLKPGVHNIRARVSDTSYSVIEQINVTLVDVTAPIVDFNEPINNTEFNIGTIVAFKGQAIDNVGVENIELMIDDDETNQIDLTSSITSGQWHYDLYTDDMNDGEHKITVRANDAADNIANATIYLTFIEITPPVVTIMSPANNSVLELGEEYYVKGYATDNKEVKILNIVIDDSDPINITTNLLQFDNSWGYYWDTGEETITDGEHLIHVQAYDAAGNLGTATIKVYLDGTPPEVNISNPVENQVFAAGDDIFIEGTANDDYGIKTVEIILEKDDPVNITNSLSDNEWDYEDWDTSDLKSGLHTITVRITDVIGHKQETSITIQIDAEAPMAIIDDISDSILIGDLITFTGKASDDILVTELELQIGMTDPINITSEFIDGKWSYECNTSDQNEGDMLVTLKVTDIVGKVSTAEISVKIISLNTDTDRDGMPDWWEIEFGLNEDKEDAELDRDRDGYTNLEEYLGDDGRPDNDDYSNPQDASSTPQLKSSDSDDSFFTIIWILMVVVVIIILILIFFMMLKKKRREEVEVEREMMESKMMTAIEPVSPPGLPLPMTFPPPQPQLPIPPPQPKREPKHDRESAKSSAATASQDALEKIELAKAKGADVSRAETLLAIAQKSFKLKKYDVALNFAVRSNVESEKLLVQDDDEEE